MSLIEIHGRLGNTAMLYTVFMALWGLWRYFRRQNVDSNYWGALAIGEVLYLGQSGLGAYLFFTGIGHLDRGYIHILYGVVSLLVIPAVYLYTKGDDQRRAMLVYGVALLFLVGVILRAIATSS